MRSFAVLLALPAAVLAVPITILPSGAEIIPNNWIFKFKEDSLMDSVIETFSNITGIAPKHTYDFGGFKGLAIEANPLVVEVLKALDFVEAVEPDSKVYTSALTTQSNAPWGLGRISRRTKGSTTYTYDTTAGQGTFSYIIDTGIYIQHSNFGGRASWGANFADNDNTDGNGHGTHVAGTVGSTTYGVAKKTSLIAVKVLAADGSGSNSGVINGIQWATNDAKNKGRIGKAVANMSLGGGYSSAVNSAVKAATDAGLFMAVAAGNDNANANNYSPASEASACTVGATDINDNRASFSNYGSALDIFAPGVNILSTWNDGNTKSISGTSMATPHIAGLGAYLLALEGSRTPAALCSRMQSLSTKNVVVDAAGSYNYLAYNGNGA